MHELQKGGFMKTRTAVAAVAAMVMATGVMMAYGQVQSVVDTTGSIDWCKRTITVTGIGVPNPDMPEATRRPAAVRAAQVLALRNALEAIKGIPISSETTIENFMVTNEYVTTSIDGFIKGFKFENKPHYMSDGSVEISVTVPLDGEKGLAGVLYGEGKGNNADKAEKADKTEKAVKGDKGDSITISVNDALKLLSIKNTPEVTAMPEPAAQTKPQVFTGLIIDAKGLGVRPAMAPKVLDEAGKEVYGSLYVSRDFAVKFGMAGYAKTVDDAAKNVDRVGKTPEKIKAIKASGANTCDVVISAGDADSIRSSAKNLKFLQECRVIIVVD
jgi:hypothetical protein